MKEILNKLIDLSDPEYKKFSAKLIPNIAPESIIGVRVPQLRSMAKEIKGEEAKKFLSELPHKYYEENNLHGYIIAKIKDFDILISEIERFLPYIDNWATCDTLSPKIKNERLPEMLPLIEKWIGSKHTYTVRFGIEMLMNFFLEDLFEPIQLNMVADIKSEEYYVNMMRAWYFATALAKQYEETVKTIESNTLDVWTHNKTIQKAAESYRITDEQKAYLKTFKRKN